MNLHITTTHHVCNSCLLEIGLRELLHVTFNF